MKKIEAYLRPENMEDVKAALKAIPVNGISISQIMGCGSQMGWKEYVRGSEVDYNFLPKIKFELFIHDAQVEPVVAAILAAAYSGDVGDGKIFILDVRDAIRIRTGERGEAAMR